MVDITQMLSNINYENMRLNDTYTLTYIYDNILIITSDRLDMKIKDIEQK